MSQNQGVSKKCGMCRERSIRQKMRSVRRDEVPADQKTTDVESESVPCSDCVDACPECKEACLECHRFNWVKGEVKGCHVNFPPEECMTNVRILTPLPKKESPLTKLMIFCCSSDKS